MQHKIFILNLLVAASFTVKAQTVKEASSEKYSTQLKNGTVPGLKFAPVTTALKPGTDDNHTEPVNTGRDIKNNKGKNVKLSATTGNGDKNISQKKSPVMASDGPLKTVRDTISTTRPATTQEVKP